MPQNWEAERARNRRLIAAAGVFCAAAFALATAGMVVFAASVTAPLGRATAQGSTLFSVLIGIAAALCAIVLFVLMLALGLSDRFARPPRPMGAAYRTLVIFAGCFAGQLVLTGLVNLDLLLHDFRPFWRPLYEPELVLVRNLLLAGAPLALAGFVGFALAGRGWTARQVAALYGCGAATIAATVALLWLASRA